MPGRTLLSKSWSTAELVQVIYARLVSHFVVLAMGSQLEPIGAQKGLFMMLYIGFQACYCEYMARQDLR